MGCKSLVQEVIEAAGHICIFLPKHFSAKIQDFAHFQRFVHHFNFLSELLHNQQSSPLICQYLSPSKFEVSIAQPLPKLAMATRSLRLHLGNKISCQQNFITMKNK